MKNINREKIRELILQGVEDALDRAESQYDTMSGKASEVIGSMKEKTGNMYNNMKSKAEFAREKTQKYVHSHPEKSLLIAAGAGALAALITVMVIKKSKGYRHCGDDY